MGDLPAGGAVAQAPQATPVDMRTLDANRTDEDRRFLVRTSQPLSLSQSLSVSLCLCDKPARAAHHAAWRGCGCVCACLRLCLRLFLCLPACLRLSLSVSLSL